MDLGSGGPFRVNSICFLECFAKVLNHFFQLVGITST